MSHNHNTEKSISLAFFLNLIFSIIEVIGGFLTNSISIMSDAFHDFGDSISLLIATICEKKSKNKPTEKYTFGYLRFSVLGAFITSLILVIGSVTILFNSIPKLFAPEEVNYDGMLLLAIIGIIINAIAAFKTSGGDNLNEKSVSLHMLEDLLGWIAVLIGSLVIKFTGLYIIDPILSILISIYILTHVVRNIKEIANLFLITSPKDYSEDTLTKLITNIPEVKDIHHIHAWSLNDNNHYLTMHVALQKVTDINKLHQLKHEIKDIIKDNLNISHVTIEFEFENEHCHEHTCSLNMESENEHHHHHHH